MSAHTPFRRVADAGDWIAEPDGYGAACYLGICDAKDKLIALVVGHADNDNEMPAVDAHMDRDAALFIAAPDLLEHMIAIAGYADAPHVDPQKALTYILQTARAAIAKAEPPSDDRREQGDGE